MLALHVQDDAAVKVEPWAERTDPRPGRTVERVAEDDPRVAAWQAQVAEERAAAAALKEATARERNALAASLKAIRAGKAEQADRDRVLLALAARLLR